MLSQTYDCQVLLVRARVQCHFFWALSPSADGDEALEKFHWIIGLMPLVWAPSQHCYDMLPRPLSDVSQQHASATGGAHRTNRCAKCTSALINAADFVCLPGFGTMGK